MAGHSLRLRARCLRIQKGPFRLVFLRGHQVLGLGRGTPYVKGPVPVGRAEQNKEKYFGS